MIKNKRRVFYSLGIGCILFYLSSGLFVIFMKLFHLNTGKHRFLSAIVIALLVSLPFVLIINLVLGLIYHFFWYRKKDNE